MNTKLIAVLGIAGFLGLSAIVLGGTAIGTYNSAASLKNLYESKVAANKGELDNVKKKIGQSGQVTQMQMESLGKIYNEHAAARTPNTDRLLVNWVKEVAPTVDQSTFKQLINVVTSSRDAWTMRQTELVDISRQYNDKLVTFPSNIFLGFMGFQKIDPKVITSTSTEEAFETGRDDDAKVFSK
jgi:hypothetical protein